MRHWPMIAIRIAITKPEVPPLQDCLASVQNLLPDSKQSNLVNALDALAEHLSSAECY